VIVANLVAGDVDCHPQGRQSGDLPRFRRAGWLWPALAPVGRGTAPCSANRLTQACGIETPEVKLIALGDKKSAIAIKRFDTDGERIFPLMSAASAMGSN